MHDCEASLQEIADSVDSLVHQLDVAGFNSFVEALNRHASALEEYNANIQKEKNYQAAKARCFGYG